VLIEHISINLMIVGHLTKESLPNTFIEHVKKMDIMVNNGF